MQSPELSPRSARVSLPFYPALDGLRALAVIAVIAYHSRLPGVRGGFLGVDLFFTISGFLITLLLLIEFGQRGTVSLKQFYIRRVRRLLPGLVLMLIVFLPVTAYFGRPPFQKAVIDVLVGLFNVANISRALGFGVPRALGHLWSLSLEVQFYILWAPFCLWVLNRWRTSRALAVACVFTGVFAYMMRLSVLGLGLGGQYIYNGTFMRLDAFAVGALLACLYMTRDWKVRLSLPRRWMLPASVTGFVALAGFVWLAHSTGFSTWTRNPEVPFLATLPAVFLVFAATGLSGQGIQQIFAFAPIQYVGKISYGLYLWHYPIIRLLRIPSVTVFEKFLIVFVLTFICAALSYHLVELPFLKARKRKTIQPASSPDDSREASEPVRLVVGDRD